MARIRQLTRDERLRGTVHPTEVDCRWQIVSGPGGARLVQLSTYGSDSRVSEPKVSQTIQIDEATARKLVGLLQETFDF